MTDARFDLEEGGGGIQAFSGPIIDAYYNENEYGCSLVLKNQFDDPENYPRFEDGCFTKYFPCGKGWKPTTDGAGIEHESGEDKKLNKGTGIGKLVAAISVIPGVSEALPGDWSAKNATSWKGLHLEWGQVPVQKNVNVNKDTPGAPDKWEKVDAFELLPVGIVGAEGAAPVATTNLDATTLGLTAEQQVALHNLAVDAATDPKFVEGLIGIEGITSNSAVMAAVSKDAPGLRKALIDVVF